MFHQTTRRIALVSPAWPAAKTHNGIVTYVSNLCAGLDAIGVSHRVLSAATEEGDDGSAPRLSEYAAPSPFERLAVRIGRRISARLAQQHVRARSLLRGIERLTREWPCDLVEVEESFGSASVLNDAGIPTIVRLHGPWFLNAEALGMPRDDDFTFRDAHERRAICGAYGLSSPSYDVLARVRAHYRVELPDAEVVPNPCPSVAERAHFRLAHCDRNLILFVGRFDRHKGADIMLDAFVRVARAVPSARLLFVGPDRGLVDQTGRAMTCDTYLDAHVPSEVRGRIEITGALPSAQISALRRRALITVVPSRYETFGMTVVEAMAHGSPLVTSGAGGIAEIVCDGKTARLFENGSAESLAKVLCELLARPDEAAALGARALRDCERRFRPEVVARQMVDFYDRVRERKTAPLRQSGVRLRASFGSARPAERRRTL